MDLVSKTSKKTGAFPQGPSYFWLCFWPLPTTIAISAAMLILASVALVIAIIIGTITGFIGAVLSLVIILFLVFVAWVLFSSLILSPFDGFNLFLDKLKKVSEYFRIKRKTQIKKVCK